MWVICSHQTSWKRHQTRAHPPLFIRCHRSGSQQFLSWKATPNTVADLQILPGAHGAHARISRSKRKTVDHRSTICGFVQTSKRGIWILSKALKNAFLWTGSSRRAGVKHTSSPLQLQQITWKPDLSIYDSFYWKKWSWDKTPYWTCKDRKPSLPHLRVSPEASLSETKRPSAH